MAGLWHCLRTDYRLLTRGHARWKRPLVALFNRGIKAVLCYRLGNWCIRRGVPVVPAVLARLAQVLYGVDIHPRADIGPGLVLVHCFGTVVGSATRVEGDCVLFHGVTLGDRGSEWVGSRRTDGHPVVSRGCIFGAGAKVLGPIRIGENCVIGANSVVLHDVPPDSVAAGLPARVVNQRPRMDANLRPLDGYRDDAHAPAVQPVEVKV